MAFDESMSLFMKIIMVIVVIAIVVALAFTFNYDTPSKNAEFQRLCFEWYKDGCGINKPGDVGELDGLCAELYPGIDCKQICNNECIV